MIKRKKIVNDPVYGFIPIPSDLVFSLIEHSYFQRLRRIKQLGLTDLVYPGALHTRFQHALGATYLMSLAIQTIRSKGHEITFEEEEAVTIAILLHDIGHGPFSHALEKTIIEGLTHEDLSEIMMNSLNDEFNGRLSLAIQIFRNEYHKKFLFQLVSGQLDVDRLDYLRRDSFFSGVSEGTIGLDRIIQMLEIVNDDLVIEAKGIYSVEKFLIARRLMYWQVYLHKAVLSAEYILMLILKRAKELSLCGEELFSSPYLKFFLKSSFNKEEILSDPELLDNVLLNYTKLDDSDIISAAKVWMHHSDKVLSYLCNCLIERKLYVVELSEEAFDSDRIAKMQKTVIDKLSIKPEEVEYYVFANSISNFAYNTNLDSIKILEKDGSLTELTEASDMLNMSMLSKGVSKFIICYPKSFKEEFEKNV